MIVVNRSEILKRMAEKNIKAADLWKKYGLGYITFKKAISGEVVGMKAIGVFCEALKCQPEDILMKVKDA